MGTTGTGPATNASETRRELRAEPWMGHGDVSAVPAQRSGYRTEDGQSSGPFQQLRGKEKKQPGSSPDSAARAGIAAVFMNGSARCEGWQLSAPCAASGIWDPFLATRIKQCICILPR